LVKWIRRSTLEPLAVSMSGLKLGDRLLVIGSSDPPLIAALASKVGLTGRTCAVDADEGRVVEAGRVAEREGALIETVTAPGWTLPFDQGAFDVVVLRSMLLLAEARAALAEARRVLRAGGRAIAIEGRRRTGLGALVGGGASSAGAAADATKILESAGFVAVRVLAEREGMVFVEGVRKKE
jgi:ubiquinone/menaquinone biosynthesis C-methylase UbiE